MSLINKDKNLVGEIISMARPLTMDDFHVKPIHSDDDKYLSFGLAAKLKQNIASDIFKHIKTNFANKLRREDGMSFFCDNCNPEIAAYINITVNQKVSFNGLKTQSQKDEKLASEFIKLKTKWSEEKETLIEAFINEANKNMLSVIENENKNVINKIKNIIFNTEERLKPTFFDNAFTADEKENISIKKDKIASLNEQIQALTLQHAQLKEEVSKAHQDVFCNVLIKGSGTSTHNVVKDILSEDIEITPEYEPFHI